MLKFDLRKIRDRQETTLLVVDLFMLVLLLVNLGWLIFDWLFAAAWFAAVIERISAAFHSYYAEVVHPNFYLIDLGFIAVFLTEFTIRWVISIRRGTYLRWYFYPFIHWYELLGCIPLVGLRVLRFLRIISMIYRLNRLGVIDLKNSALGEFAGTYYNVFVEEISDRVVLNVLEGVQAELRSGQPVTHRIVDEVILARKAELLEQLGRRIEEILRDNYEFNREAIHEYVDQRIRASVEQSQDVSRMSRIPIFGSYASRVLERSVSQIVQAVIDGAASDLQSAENRQVIEEIVRAAVEVLLDQGDQFHSVTNQMIIDAIDIVKERVRVQRWRGQFAQAPDQSG